jgi:hypothetical protein
MKYANCLITIRIFLSILLVTCCINFATAQIEDNKGRDFWVAYSNHVLMYNDTGTINTTGGAQVMQLYFVAQNACTIVVEIPWIGYTRMYAMAANSVLTTEAFPESGLQDVRILEEGLSTKGIHITSTEDIIAFSHVFAGSISGMSILLPTKSLSDTYYSINFSQVSNKKNSKSFVYAIASEDSTILEIIPSVNTEKISRGDTLRVFLNKGQLYNIFGKVNGFKGEDLTGTVIRSLAKPGQPCKKIAVFSGSGNVGINCSATSSSADNLMQQCLPASTWGKRFLTSNTKGMPNNIYRILAQKKNTAITINGSLFVNIGQGEFYQYSSATPDLIEATEPITVAQYITTANSCGNIQLGGVGDPEMIYLSSIEQGVKGALFNSTSNARIVQHYANIVIHKKGLSSLKIDGINSPFVEYQKHPSDTNFVVLQINLTAGYHFFVSDSTFNAIAYGYGSAESYGYNAGVGLQNLNGENCTQTNWVSTTCDSTKKPIFEKNEYGYCSSDSVKIQIKNNNKSDVYFWKINNKTIDATGPSIFIKNPDTVYVVKLDSLGCITNSDTIRIVKYALPQAPTISRSTDNSLVSNYTYGNSWFFESTNLSDTASKIKPTQQGYYTVRSTQLGCPSALSAPNYYLTTAVNTFTLNTLIQVSPNPTKGFLRINVTDASLTSIYVTIKDVNGVTRFSRFKLKKDVTLDINHFGKGVYHICFYDLSGKMISSKKIIKL